MDCCDWDKCTLYGECLMKKIDCPLPKIPIEKSKKIE